MQLLNFQALGLNHRLVSALDKLGYNRPTPIQAQSIPIVLAGHDLLATAQTGTGKTASFVLPLLQNLSRASSGPNQGPRSNRKRSPLKPTDPYTPMALVLAPTRELAIQIDESIQGYGQETELRPGLIFGGVPQGEQLRKLSSRPKVLVATPGRLLAYINDGLVSLEGVSHLVLDEADRMLDMGFIGDVKKIARLTGKRKQTLLFSATMPPAIEELGAFLLKDPKRVAIAPKEVAVDRIRQSVFHLERPNKTKLLKQLIKDRSMYKVIVFTRTKHRAARVAKILQKSGIPSDSIHGDRNQNQRQRALASLASAKIQALVATDVAARGIDVDDVTHVINFEIPHESESYVHRIGRTARAGQDGDALSLCDPEELEDLWAIEKLIGKTLPVDSDHEFHLEPMSKPLQKSKTKELRGKKKGQSRSQNRGPSQKAEGRKSREGKVPASKDKDKSIQVKSERKPKKGSRPKNGGQNSSKKWQTSTEKDGANQAKASRKPKNPRAGSSEKPGSLSRGQDSQRDRGRSARDKARASIMEALGSSLRKRGGR